MAVLATERGVRSCSSCSKPAHSAMCSTRCIGCVYTEPYKYKTHRRQCKMSSSKKLTCKGTVPHVFICMRAQNPIPPPPLTHCKRVYIILYLFTKGGGGRVEPERRLEGQQFSKLSRKYQHDYSDKPLPQSPFTGQFFR